MSAGSNLRKHSSAPFGSRVPLDCNRPVYEDELDGPGRAFSRAAINGISRVSCQHCSRRSKHIAPDCHRCTRRHVTPSLSRSPGSYDVHARSGQRRAPAAQHGFSISQRGADASGRGEMPGPGAYDPYAGAAAAPKRYVGLDRRAAFSSNTNRFRRLEDQPTASVGPGAYVDVRGAAAPAPELQFCAMFCSSRFYSHRASSASLTEQGIRRRCAEAQAPGGRLRLSGTTLWHHRAESGHADPGGGRCSRFCARVRAPIRNITVEPPCAHQFLCSSPSPPSRPGAYDVEPKPGATLTRQYRKQSAAFASTTARLEGNPNVALEPGPGTAARALSACASDRACCTWMRSAEAAPTHSAPCTRRRPAGLYETRPEWDKDKQRGYKTGKSVFVTRARRRGRAAELCTGKCLHSLRILILILKVSFSQEKRFANSLPKHLVLGPGPGQYESEQQRLWATVPRGALLSTTGPRFEQGPRLYVPGPGQYTVNRELAKPSFNVTFD